MNGVVHGYLLLTTGEELLLGYGGCLAAHQAYEAAKLKDKPTFQISDVDGQRHFIATDKYVRAWERR